MNRIIATASRLLVLALPLLIAMPQDEPGKKTDAAPRHEVSSLSFLAGTWKGKAWGGVFHAYYSTPVGGKVISHSRLMMGEREAFYEFEVFEQSADGVKLQPYPGGKKAVALELVAVDAKSRKATFENPEKDYPTRIVYHRAEDGRLVITLSDPHGTSEKVETFDLTR